MIRAIILAALVSFITAGPVLAQEREETIVVSGYDVLFPTRTPAAVYDLGDGYRFFIETWESEAEMARVCFQFEDEPRVCDDISVPVLPHAIPTTQVATRGCTPLVSVTFLAASRPDSRSRQAGLSIIFFDDRIFASYREFGEYSLTACDGGD